MKKETKRKVLGLVGAGAVLFGVANCDNGTTSPKCECAPGTTHEPGETCCGGGSDCGCVEMQKIFIRDLPVDAPGLKINIIDGRINHGNVSLDNSVIDKITRAFADTYNEEANGLEFKLVFGGNGGTIIVENDPADYYNFVRVVGTKIYIHTVFLASWPDPVDSDIRNEIFGAVSAAVVVYKSPSRNTIRLAKAPVDAKAFARQVLAQIPQRQQAIRQRVALTGRMSRQHG